MTMMRHIPYERVCVHSSAAGAAMSSAPAELEVLLTEEGVVAKVELLIAAPSGGASRVSITPMWPAIAAHAWSLLGHERPSASNGATNCRPGGPTWGANPLLVSGQRNLSLVKLAFDQKTRNTGCPRAGPCRALAKRAVPCQSVPGPCKTVQFFDDFFRRQPYMK